MDDNEKRDLIDQMKKKRKSLGLGRLHVAEMIGVTKNTIARWERHEVLPMNLSINAIKDFLKYL
jgi:predicted transcriptional regulator